MTETAAIGGRFTLAEIEAIDRYCKEAKITKTELVRRAVLQLLGLPRGEWKDGSREPGPVAATARIPPSPPATPATMPAGAARRAVNRRGDEDAGYSTWTCPRCHAVMRLGERADHYERACPVLHPQPAPAETSG